MKRTSFMKKVTGVFATFALAATMTPLAGIALPGSGAIEEAHAADAAGDAGAQVCITTPIRIDFGSQDSPVDPDTANSQDYLKSSTDVYFRNVGNDVGMAVSGIEYTAPDWAKYTTDDAQEHGHIIRTSEGDIKDSTDLFRMVKSKADPSSDDKDTVKLGFASNGEGKLDWQNGGVSNDLNDLMDVQPGQSRGYDFYLALASKGNTLNAKAAVKDNRSPLGTIKFTFSEFTTKGDSELTAKSADELATTDFYLKDKRDNAPGGQNQVYSLDQVSRASASISKYQYTDGNAVKSYSPYYQWYSALLQADIDQQLEATESPNGVSPIDAYECRTYWGSHSKNLTKRDSMGDWYPISRDNATYDVRIIGILHDTKAIIDGNGRPVADGADEASALVQMNGAKEVKSGLTFQFVYLMDEGDVSPWTYGFTNNFMRSYGYRFNFSSTLKSPEAANWFDNDGSTSTNATSWAGSELRWRMNNSYDSGSYAQKGAYTALTGSNYNLWTPEESSPMNSGKTIFDLAPATLTSKMVPVVKQTSVFNPLPEESTNFADQTGKDHYTVDKMFLASFSELTGNTGGYGFSSVPASNKAILNGNDGSQYAFYQGLKSASLTVKLQKRHQWQVDESIDSIKANSSENGSAGQWWSRSVCPGSPTNFLNVDGLGGTASYYFSGHARGVVPCFSL